MGIRRYIMEDDAPNYADRDFPVKYKTIPDGIMILQSTRDDFLTSSTISCDDRIPLETPAMLLQHLLNCTPEKPINCKEEELQKQLLRAGLKIDKTYQPEVCPIRAREGVLQENGDISETTSLIEEMKLFAEENDSRLYSFKSVFPAFQRFLETIYLTYNWYSLSYEV